MELTRFFPPEILEWLFRYGLFLGICLFVFLLALVLFRPFWLWFSGQGEALDRLRRLDEDQRKVLFELEMLNKTLSIPLKKSGVSTSAAKKTPEPEIDTGEFLRGLEKARKNLGP